MVEWTTLQQECQEPKKKEEACNDVDHAYQKALIKYKRKIEGLERQRELWLQEHDTKNQTMEKMMVQILQMKNMISREELHRLKAEHEKEQAVIKMNDLRKEMVKTKSKLDDFVKKNISLDPSYVNHRLEECNELVQYYSIMCTKQQMDDSNVELNEWWELAEFKEEM